jgi:ribose/xylose/arabinose/galactoside ABC-type transport system permease subunit
VTVNTATAAPAPKARRNWAAFFGQFGALIVLILICAIFAWFEPAFLSTINLFNILRQISIYGLLAIGMTFVILTGGIDLSVGSVLALAGIVAAGVYKGAFDLLGAGTAGQATGAPLWVAVIAALLVGVAAGALQGGAVVGLKVPPFIATLGGITAFRGLALMLSGGQPISTFQRDYTFWGQGLIGPVPVPVIIFLVFAIIGWIILAFTRYGRHVYAVGGNAEAARLSGLNTNRITLSVYVISGFMAGLCGFLLSSRLNSAEQVAGVGYELTVIAGVVIGGTSFSGGEGTIRGTVIGIILIGVLANGLTLMNVNPYIQQILTGLIIVFAVFFDQVVKRRR